MIRLVTFEGGDGSGKTTQLKWLERYLVDRDGECVATREPGATALGQMIRQLLLEVRKEEPSPPTELFLYLADRAQHVREVIEPALEKKRLVLCDRFTDSTLAYQGYGRGFDLALLKKLNQIASRGIAPDLTFLLDCPVEVGRSRTRQRLQSSKPPSLLAGGPGSWEAGKLEGQDRFEREKIEFHERVRLGFLELARAEPERIVVLDASRPMLKVHEEIKDIMDRKLANG